jgi:hypothetical protein
MSNAVDPALAAGNLARAADYQTMHFLWSSSGRVATITLNAPRRRHRRSASPRRISPRLSRIYEGATEVQQLIIARELLKQAMG